MSLQVNYPLSTLMLALLLAGCGGGGDSSGGGSTDPDDNDLSDAVWQFEKIIDLSSNGGLTSNRISVIVDAQEVPHFYYFTGDTSEDYQLMHQQWDADAQSLSSAENILTNSTGTLDNTETFALASSGDYLFTAYQGGEFRECNEDVMSDAMFSVHDGSSWSEYTAGIGYVERNPVLTDGFAGANLSIAADSAGGVHVSYQFYYEGCDSFNTNYPDLLYVYKAADEFALDATEETIEGSDLEDDNAQNNVGQFNQLILDADDQPVVFYAAELADTSSTRGLRYAYKADGEWVNEWVEADCDVEGISAALTPENQLAVAYYVSGCDHLSFYEDFEHGVRYAVQGDDGWEISMVEDTALAGEYLSLAFDAQGNPAVAYRSLETYSGIETKDLKLARYNYDGNSGWSREQVLGTGDIGWYNSLWFDQDGTTNIVSYSNSEQKVYWFKKEE